MAWLLVVVVIAEAAWVRLCDDLATDADATEADADEDESDEEVAFVACCTVEVVAW